MKSPHVLAAAGSLQAGCLLGFIVVNSQRAQARDQGPCVPSLGQPCHTGLCWGVDKSVANYGVGMGMRVGAGLLGRSCGSKLL